MIDKGFVAYLESIAATQVARRRVEEVLSFYRDVLPSHEPIGLVFLSEETDDARAFNSLWLCTPTYLCEASNFLHEDRFQFDVLVGRVTNVDVRRSPRDEYPQRLIVEYSSDDLNGTLFATGENCAQLRRLLTDYLVRPNSKP